MKKERRELASRTYRGLEEEWEQATAWIMRQPDRHALFHIRGKRPMRMVTPEVREPKVTKQFLALRVRKTLEASGKPRAEVELEIQRRKSSLKLSRPAPRKSPTRFPVHSQYEGQE